MEEIARNVDRIVLLNKGNIVMDGTPAHVFSESERLRKLGLAAPKASLIATKLRAMGLPLEQDIYTLKRLRRNLNELKRQERQGDRPPVLDANDGGEKHA
jgi:ABC-type multidrug transport system ATPase subunit